MNIDFQFVALPRQNFSHLFSMSDAELKEHGARRLTVDSYPGYPCRVGLVDAKQGDTVILTPFKHHDVNSPYQATGPIFVSETSRTANPAVNEVPLMLRHRLLSVRAYTKEGLMRDRTVAEGAKLEETIQQLFSNEETAYLHVHNAGAGCFNCQVLRV